MGDYGMNTKDELINEIEEIVEFLFKSLKEGRKLNLDYWENELVKCINMLEEYD